MCLCEIISSPLIGQKGTSLQDEEWNTQGQELYKQEQEWFTRDPKWYTWDQDCYINMDHEW